MSDQLFEKVEKIAEAINTAQEANTKNWSNTEACLKETQKKAAESATEMMNEIQDAKMKLKGIEEKNKFLERQMSRMPMGGEAANSEFDKKAHEALCMYLKKGTAIEEGIVESISEDMMKKTLHGVTSDQRELYKKDLIAGVNPDGGYFIRPQYAATMIQRIFETSPMRLYADTMTTTSDVVKMLIDDDEADTGGWVGEVQSRPNTNTPQIGELNIPVHEVYAQPRATQKMLDDAGFDIEAWLSRKVTNVITRFENTAFVKGDGSQRPKGILSYPDYSQAGKDATYERFAVERVVAGQTDTIQGDDLKKIQNQVKEDYQTRAIWAMKRGTFEQIITLKDNQGRYIFDTRFLQTKDPMNLLGRQVAFMNDLPLLSGDGFSGSILPIAYGDFSVGYTIVDGVGFRVLRDPYTEKPYIRYYTTKNTGGAVTNYESFKLLQVNGSL